VNEQILSYSTDGIYAALYVARRNTAKAEITLDMELDVITTVVLVGTSIFGGRGTIIGTLLAFS
jgi:rhamnose transport system permease protein